MLITNSSNAFFINPVLLASHESSGRIIPDACRAQIKAALWHGASSAHSLAGDTRSQHGYTEPRKGLHSFLSISFSFLVIRNQTKPCAWLRAASSSVTKFTSQRKVISAFLNTHIHSLFTLRPLQTPSAKLQIQNYPSSHICLLTLILTTTLASIFLGVIYQHSKLDSTEILSCTNIFCIFYVSFFHEETHTHTHQTALCNCSVI